MKKSSYGCIVGVSTFVGNTSAIEEREVQMEIREVRVSDAAFMVELMDPAGR